MNNLEALDLYRNNLKNRDFGEEGPLHSHLERGTIAERQGPGESANSETNTKWPQSDSSGCFGMTSKKKGLLSPPFIPRLSPLKFADLCKLPLLWQMAEEPQAASHLAHLLLQFRKNPPFSLFCPENQYDEQDASASFDHLLKVASHWQLEAPQAPLLDLSIYEEGEAIYTLDGNGTSLGILKKEGFEVRAMGPQPLPLNGANGFGVAGKGEKGWARCQAQPEVWIEVKSSLEQLDLRFVGLKKERPLAFVFYIKASHCQVESEILKPRSLARFSAETKCVSFGNWSIVSSTPHKVQIIPLAGDGAFWNTDFLVSFEIHPIVAQASFAFRSCLAK